MKNLIIIFFLLGSTAVFAQHQANPGPQGQGVAIPAAKLESFMGTKPRINTKVEGRVTKVTNPKGGWFIMDAGNGKTINAHFKSIDSKLPGNITGKKIVMEGTASKIFDADDKQHYVSGEATKKTPNKGGIDFEVTNIKVE